MQLLHFYHGHRLHRFASHPDFSLFELAVWLHALARSLVAIFVPILMVQTGYAVGEVIIFYLIFNSIDVPLNFAVDRLMRKIGARRVLILGTVALIAFFGLLAFLPPANWPLLILLAFLGAAYDTLFWISYVYIFIETSKQGLDTGQAVGAIEAVRKLAHIAGPVIGALVLVTVGKSFLIMASIAIFALSIVPLSRIRHLRDVPHEKKLSSLKFFSKAPEKRNYLSIALWGIHAEVDEVLWPLFIFTVVGTIGSVAAVPVIVAFTAIAFSYLAGKLTKRYGSRMIMIGSLLIACAWVLRLSFQNPLLYYATVFLVGIFALLVIVPLDGSVAARGQKIGSLAASTYRNTISMAARIPLYLALALMVQVFKVSFVLAATSLFLILAVTFLFTSSGILKPYRNHK